MNYKYLGEAIALLGIAYSIIRWIARNAPGADVRHRDRGEIDIVSVTRPTGGDRKWTTSPGSSRRGGSSDDGDSTRARPDSDPRLMEAAAAQFGIAPDALARMDARERALLVSGYRAILASRDGDDQPGGER